VATIPYADVQNIERLPIDAQEVVTKVRLVIAGNIGGSRDTFFSGAIDDFYLDDTPNTGNDVTTAPLPAVYTYEASEHASYGCERSLALPEGFNPFLPPTDDLVGEPGTVNNFTNPGTPSAIRDGDPTTFATLSGSSTFTGQILYGTNQPSCGWLLRYSLINAGSSPWARYVNSLHTHLDGDPKSRTLVRRAWQLPSTNAIDEPTELYAISLHDARGENENMGDGWVRVSNYSLNIVGDGGAEARVYAYYPLILDQDLLEQVAKANIRLPALIPQRVTVTGIVAPDREHTITGWPGGDFTGKVAQHQYELGRTVIDFEQAGAPTGLPAEAVEAARERTVAVQSEVQRAGYSVKMGERQ